METTKINKELSKELNLLLAVFHNLFFDHF